MLCHKCQQKITPKNRPSKAERKLLRKEEEDRRVQEVIDACPEHDWYLYKKDVPYHPLYSSSTFNVWKCQNCPATKDDMPEEDRGICFA